MTLSFIGAIQSARLSIGIDGIDTRTQSAHIVAFDNVYCIRRTMLQVSEMTYVQHIDTGYIAGTADGIVSANGVQALREIIAIDADDPTYAIVKRVHSLPNGRYLIDNLDPAKRYLVMCRDCVANHNIKLGEYQPAVFDNVVPAHDLNLAQISALWQEFIDD